MGTCRCYWICSPSSHRHSSAPLLSHPAPGPPAPSSRQLAPIWDYERVTDKITSTAASQSHPDKHCVQVASPIVTAAHPPTHGRRQDDQIICSWRRRHIGSPEYDQKGKNELKTKQGLVEPIQIGEPSTGRRPSVPMSRLYLD